MAQVFEESGIIFSESFSVEFGVLEFSDRLEPKER